VALARTDIGLYESKGAIGKAAYVSPSFTPPANSLLVVAVNFIGEGLSGDLGTPTVSGGGLTYTSRVAATGTPAWCTKLVVFTAPVGSSPSSMTLTVDDDNDQVIAGYVLSVVAFTGYDTTTPVAGAVTSGTTNIADGAETQTLAATPTAEDVSLSWVLIDGEPGPPKPTMAAGWTKIHEGRFYGSEGGVFAMRRESSTSTSVTVTDIWTSGTFYKASMVSLIVKAGKEEGGKALKIEIADTGKGADGLGGAAASTLSDAGKGADAKTTAASSTLTDAGKGSDSRTTATTSALSDSGKGTDKASTASTGALSDSGKGSDKAASGTTAAFGDSGKGTDALTGAQGAALSDAGRGSDSVAGKAAAGLQDGGLGLDALAGFMAAAFADQGVGDDEIELLMNLAWRPTLPTRARVFQIASRAGVAALDFRAVVEPVSTRAGVLPSQESRATVAAATATAARVGPNPVTGASIDKQRTRARVPHG